MTKHALFAATAVRKLLHLSLPKAWYCCWAAFGPTATQERQGQGPVADNVLVMR